MDKEIIIDGVNVAWCEFAVKPKNDNRIKCHCAKGLLQIAKMQEQPESIKSGLCENNPNCYYKQLKRLKQENERLKEANQSLSMLGTDLASANETVRKEFFRVDKNKDMWREKTEKLQQTLQEIKEIAEKYMFLKPDILTLKGDIGYIQNKLAVEILQLITKAEEE